MNINLYPPSYLAMSNAALQALYKERKQLYDSLGEPNSRDDNGRERKQLLRESLGMIERLLKEREQGNDSI